MFYVVTSFLVSDKYYECPVFLEAIIIHYVDSASGRYTLPTCYHVGLARYSLYLTISGLGFLSQLIRLWSKPHYRFTLNEESYFADTELAGFNERILIYVRTEDRS